MSKCDLDRRDFSRLSLAVLSGLVAGTEAVAQEPPAPIEDPGPPSIKPPASPAATPPAGPQAPAESDKSAEMPDEPGQVVKKKKNDKPKEVHICRGLNTCKEKGRGGENKCAGRGDCATTPASPHQCAAYNLCKGQGGCGKIAGKNQCYGMGDGGVPILEEDWPRLRAEFEVKMKRLKMAIGPAPLSVDEERWIRRKQEADARALAEMEAAKQAEAEAAKNGKQPKANDSAAAKNAKNKDDKYAKDKNPGDKNPMDNNPKDKGSVDALDELTGGKDKSKGAAPKSPAPK